MKFFYENKESSVYAVLGNHVSFPAHLHHHIELVYMMEGRVHAMADAAECILRPGDVFIAFPNQIHSYQRLEQERFFLCIFPPELCPEFEQIFHHKIPASPCVANAFSEKELMPLFECIVHAAQAPHSIYQESYLKGCLLILLSHLFEKTSFQKADSPDSDTLKALLHYCQARYKQDISLDQAAADLHISKYYISRLFSNKLHISFCEYINMHRVSEACTLLKNRDLSMTEVCLRTGFGSLRSFNRNFLKYAGTSSTAYRNLNANKNL